MLELCVYDTVDPTPANNDSANSPGAPGNIIRGKRWVNTATTPPREFICLNATGSAVWVRTSLDSSDIDAPVEIVGTSYTVQASDLGKRLYTTSASPVTITIPPGLGAGFNTAIQKGGTGDVTLDPGAGVTLDGAATTITEAGGLVALVPSTIAETYHLVGAVGGVALADISDMSADARAWNAGTDAQLAAALEPHLNLAAGNSIIATLTHNGAGSGPVEGDIVSITMAAGWSATGWQWTLDGVAISGATAGEYQVQAGDTGELSVSLQGLIYTPTALMIGGADVTAPTLQSVVVSDANPSEIAYTFDEPLDGASVPASSDFVVASDGAAINTTGTAVISGSTITVPVDRAVVFGEALTTGYTAGANPLRDAAANNVANFSGQAVTNNVADPGDVTAPALLSVVVSDANPNEVVFTYDESLDETSVPASSDYAVASDGAAINTTGTAVISGATSTVPVDRAVVFGEALTADYTVGANPVRDLAGNNAAALTGEAITNNVSDPAASDPASIFGANLISLIDPSDGAMTVNADGSGGAPSADDFVGQIVDSADAAPWNSPDAATRLIYRTDGVTHRLESDGTKKLSRSLSRTGDVYLALALELTFTGDQVTYPMALYQAASSDWWNGPYIRMYYNEFLVPNGTLQLRSRDFGANAEGPQIVTGSPFIVEAWVETGTTYISINGSGPATVESVGTDPEITDVLALFSMPGNVAAPMDLYAGVTTNVIPDATQRTNTRAWLEGKAGL